MKQSNVISMISAQKRASIVRRYAELSRQMSSLKRQLDALKLEAVEALGEGEHLAASATLTIKWVDREVFDQAKAKSFLTAGQLAQCAKLSSFYDVRCKEV